MEESNNNKEQQCIWRNADWRRCSRLLPNGQHFCGEHRNILRTPFFLQIIGLVGAFASIVGVLPLILPSDDPVPNAIFQQELLDAQQAALNVAGDRELLDAKLTKGEARNNLDQLSQKARESLKKVELFIIKYEKTDALSLRDFSEISAFYRAIDANIKSDDSAVIDAIPDGLLSLYIERRNSSPELPEYGLVTMRATAEVYSGDPAVALKYIRLVKDQSRILLPGKITEIDALIKIGDLQQARQKCRDYADLFTESKPEYSLVFHAMNYAINCDAVDLTEVEKDKLYKKAIESFQVALINNANDAEKAAYIEILFQILANRIIQSGSNALEEMELLAKQYVDVVPQQTSIPPDSGDYYLNRANTLFRSGAAEELVLEALGKSIARFEAASPDLANLYWSYVQAYVLRAGIIIKYDSRKNEAAQDLLKAKELIVTSRSDKDPETVRQMNIRIDAALQSIKQ